MKVELNAKKLDQQYFLGLRKEVLSKWHTGSEVDLGQTVSYLGSLPRHKNYALKLKKAHKSGQTMIRTDSGVPRISEQIDYLQHLQNNGQADFLGTMVDSLTRNHRYEQAQKELERSRQTGKWTINGFPMVTHGVEGVKKITEAVDLPVMIRGVGPDWRLIAEIGFAGGHSATSGTPLQSFSQYSKVLTLPEVISYYQYMYRLMGYYEDHGVALVVSITGNFGIITPFSILLAGAIIDALIAASQGVKNVSMTVNTQGNLAQDIAAVHTLRKLSRVYLDRLGHGDVFSTMNCTNWSGKFPEDTFQASAIIALGVMVAVATKSEIAHLKTIEEAKSIPKRDSNVATLKLAKTIINMLEGQEFDLPGKSIRPEAEMLEKETMMIVDKVLEMGDGDPVVGEIKAVEAGVIDFPFATNRNVPCRIKGVRDGKGMIRYLDTGNLPFDREIIDFHAQKLAQRAELQQREVDYRTIISDLSAIGKGRLMEL